MLKLFLTLVAVLLLPNLITSQESLPSEYYEWFDSKIGVANTPLYNGISYTDQRPSVGEKNKYFLTSGFDLGSVTYFGQPYFGVSLNYDVFNDQLLFQLKDVFEGSILKPVQNEVSSFTLGKNHFINIRNFDPTKPAAFYELLTKNEQVAILKKHRKTEKKKLDREVTYYQYLERDPFYFVYTKSTLTRVEEAKDLYEAFAEKKDAIKAFFKERRSLKKNDPDAFYIQLGGFLNTLNEMR